MIARRSLLCASLLLAACHATPIAPAGETSEPEGVEGETALADSEPSVHVTGVVPMRGKAAHKRPKVFLQAIPDGDVVAQEVESDGRFDFGPLAAGRYRVGVHEPLDRNGPWLFHHAEVAVSAGQGAHLVIGPFDDPATLRLRAEKETPPFVFVIVRGDEPPPPLRKFGNFIDDDEMPPERILFALTDDGHGPFLVPPLPAGRYQIWTVANDWESGDPPVTLRAWPIELKAGERHTVTLRKRLVELEIR